VSIEKLTSVFSNDNPFFLVNYLMDNFSKNVNVSELKFGRVMFKLFSLTYHG